MVFPVVMYECESWTIKKAECWRIDTFELWCWRRFLRVPWAARRSNQSILKDSLKGLMLKLKLQYFGHLMWRGNSLEKTLMLGGIGGRRRRGRQRMRWLDGITDTMDSRSWWWTGRRPGVLQSMGTQSRTRLSDWTELNWTPVVCSWMYLFFQRQWISLNSSLHFPPCRMTMWHNPQWWAPQVS